jgi:predicted nucleotidyltransferase
MTDQHTALVGTREASEIFRVRPPNFVRDWAARPDFPAPVATLRTGRIWRRDELEAYRARSGPRRGTARSALALSPAAERWLPTIKRRIVRRFHPERIIVFGSQARGEARDDSDLDLLVVMSEVDDLRAARVAIRRALADVPIAKDIVVTTPARLDRYGNLIGSVLRPAIRDGVTIYARA